MVWSVVGGIAGTDISCICEFPVEDISISGLAAEYIVAIDVTRARFPADALASHILLVSAGPCT